MRHTAIVVSFLLMFPLSSYPQWISVKWPDIPRTATGAPNLDAPVPKTFDGKPDLSGIWKFIPNADRIRNGQGRAGIRYNFPKIEVPVRPSARQLWDKRFEVDAGSGRPSERCLPHAVPDSLFFGMFKILQTTREVAVLEEEFNYYRQIHTDGRSHPVDPEPAWFGYSIGAWDGDTLVVHTKGFKIGSWLDYGWLDDSGIPYSPALQVTERFHRENFGRMHLDVTFDDPGVFTRAWGLSANFELVPDTELIEDVCENERDMRHNGKRAAAVE